MPATKDVVTFPALPSNPSKDAEVQWLLSVTQTLKGMDHDTYLRSLLNGSLPNWFMNRVNDDWGCDLLAEYEREVAKNRAFASDLEAQAKHHNQVRTELTDERDHAERRCASVEESKQALEHILESTYRKLNRAVELMEYQSEILKSAQTYLASRWLTSEPVDIEVMRKILANAPASLALETE